MASLPPSKPASHPASLEDRKLLSEYRLDPNDGDINLDFGQPPKPWRKVALAVFLLLLGTVLLFTGVGFYVTGQKNVLPMLIIGCIAFLPGFYHSRIAYLAWRGYRGYSMNMIPDV